MDSRTCSRPGCDRLLNTGSMYCSRSCAAKDRSRRRRIDHDITELSSSARELIPVQIVDTFAQRLGEDAVPLLEEMAVELQESNLPVPLMSNMTIGEQFNSTYGYGALLTPYESYRPDDNLSFEKISRMMRNGQVVFGVEMKKSWIRSALRDGRSWDIDCADDHMRDIVKAMVNRVMRQHSGDFLESMIYGAYFGEKVFNRQPASYWGLEGGDKLIGYEKINPVFPETIQKILYTNDRKFNGFVQDPTTTLIAMDTIEVERDLSLILTYNKRFRNLWGESILRAVYPFWVWFEIAYRSWLRYLERMGVPVTVCYAPSRGEVRVPDGDPVRSMKYALLVAGNVAKSNAIALPSDVNPDTGKPLWEIKYLADDKRAAQFETAIHELGTQIIRSLVIGDQSIEQGSTGSYAASQTHFAVTMLHNEHVLSQYIDQMNRYLIPQIVRYNGEANSPPAIMIAEGLDQSEKERFFGLLNTLGNQADSHAMGYIDWLEVMNLAGLPVLDEDEVKKNEDEALDRQEKQMKMASQFSQPLASKEQQKGKESPGVDNNVKKSIDYAMYQVANADQAPIILSADSAGELLDRFGNRATIISLYNPYHDELGRFTTKTGGTAFAIPKEYDTEQMIGHMQKNFKIVTDEDGNRVAIFKEYVGEDEQIWPYNLWGGEAENFRGGRGIAGREVAASMVANKIGMGDFVANTEWATIDGKEGSLQEWVSGVQSWKRPQSLVAENKRRMAVFDYLIGNVDRHFRNILFDEGKVKAIDNGYSFPDIGGADLRKYIAGLANIHTSFLTPPVPTSSERSSIGKMLEDKDFLSELETFIGPGALEDFIKRSEVYAS